jgi:hypothetical protein
MCVPYTQGFTPAVHQHHLGPVLPSSPMPFVSTPTTTGELPHESALPCTPPGRNCLSATQAASPQLTKEEEEEEEEEGRCLAPDTPALVQMSSPPSVSVHSGSAAHR